MDGQLAGASTEGMAGADWSTAQRLFTHSGSETQGSGNHSGICFRAFHGLAFDTSRNCLLFT
jgi:hypothetical protein